MALFLGPEGKIRTMQIYIVTLYFLVHDWWFWVQLTVVHHWLYMN